MYEDPIWDGTYESLPGGYRIDLADCRRFYAGLDYKIVNSDGEVSSIEHNVQTFELFGYYYEIWENCANWGLPFKYWTEAPCWLLQLIKSFNRIEKEIATFS